ncbi:hypothetical protein RirG_220070 [Rhizophagus irregularis DAOM 197198w]|uniref:HAT C-terminal dimerisation domain-containing protein n=1 Tax=Rhizophagus irregularis (strain DAOM 197198w) TaxID=1432141 RepID=A0A015K953_RHIIW|nr:hypothetical protein RirG_220070 [Rhizophagus irregularis DAOM 197198w]
MNIVVQDILKQIKAGEAQTEDFILDNIDETIPAGEIIPKLRKLIVKIRSSPQYKERFARQAEAADLKGLNLILDIRTWWNSTHDMLERALEMREALDATASSDKDLRIFELNENEWNTIKEIMSVLKVFIRATKVVSSAKYPILSTTIPIYNFLIDKLESYCDKSNYSDIANAVKVGINKLDTYYTKTDDTNMYTVATVLDPRLKLNYYEDNKWKHSFIRYAKETVLSIYNANYAPSATDGHLEDINDDENDEFLDQLFGKQKKNQENEVELYLKTPRTLRKEDILLWWKTHKATFPNLAKMGRDYLAITGK